MKNRRSIAVTGVLWSAVGMSSVACSKGDSVNAQNPDAGQTQDGGVQISACGSLGAQQAAQLTAQRLEDFGTVGLTSLAGFENSRVAARLVTLGDSIIFDPFVADAQSDLHDALVKLRDEQLVAGNVESATDSSVTFLLRPETVCTTSSTPPPAIGTGGTSAASTSTTLDPNCVADATAHPTRIRISRIACDQGDNIAIELLEGQQSEHILSAALYPDHAVFDVDVGAFLRQSYSVSYSTTMQSDGTYVQNRTEKPLVSAAAGQLVGTLTLLGPHRVNGVVSIARAIDVALADDPTTRIQLAAAPNAILVNADGDAKTAQVALNTGALSWRTKFTYFIQDFFGLQTNAGADTAEPVSLSVAQAKASLAFDGTTDSITATNLDLGATGFTAIQAPNTLLALTAANSQGAPAEGIFTGNTDNNLRLSLPTGLDLRIRYGLQPTLSLVQSPANFLAADTLTFSAPNATALTLFNYPATNTILVLQDPTGQLLRVDAGSLGIASTLWASDSVTVPPSQCLTRTITSTTDHHDLLDDFTVGSCTP